MHTKVSEIESEIARWQRAVDTEGVWLFLASLGCWSVTNRWFQIAAFIVALVLFIWRLTLRKKNKTPFSRRIEELKKELAQEPEALTELGRISDDYLTISAFKRSGVPYLLCWFFFVGSFAYSIWQACPCKK